MFARSFVIASLIPVAACTTQPSKDPGPPGPLGAPNFAGGGKTDNPMAGDPRQVGCALEYDVFSPTFAYVNASNVVTTLGDIAANGKITGDQAYGMQLHVNADPAAQLPLSVQLLNSVDGSLVTYVQLPIPATGYSGYVFDLGGTIPPHTVTTNGMTQTFDVVRGFCTISAQ